MPKKNTPPRIPQAQIRSAVNRAFAIVTNELRLELHRSAKTELVRDVPRSSIREKVRELLRGQHGHDAVTRELSDISPVSDSRIDRVAETLAPRWNAVPVETNYRLTVTHVIGKAHY